MTEQSARDWLLKIAQEVEDDPTRWTRNELARDANGEYVTPLNKDACAWCAIGFTHRLDCPGGWVIKDKLKSASGVRLVSYYNDSLKTSAEFCAWFRRAAELCT